MNLRGVLDIIEGKAISKAMDLDLEVTTGGGADLMSDVLAFAQEGMLLMTGLINPQVVRTAKMAGTAAIVFVPARFPHRRPSHWQSRRASHCWPPSIRCLRRAAGFSQPDSLLTASSS